MKPYVFDVKRASVHDGPGLRTVIFFKGCNLDCFWCHNPESKSPYPQIAFFREKCISCRACNAACPHPQACTACGACTEVCPTEARKRYGEPFSEEKLLDVILADAPYYAASGGGVTFSGGECMLYPETVARLARRCRENGVSVAVDTAGNVPFSSFEAVMQDVDLFLYDVKALDSDLHRRGTGADNRRILDNLDRLLQANANVLVRVPCIPDFNDGEELARIRDYCEKRGLPVEVLTYHTLGESKKAALLASACPTC